LYGIIKMNNRIEIGHNNTLQKWMEGRKIKYLAKLTGYTIQTASKLINAEPGYDPKLSQLLKLREATGLTLNELANSFEHIGDNRNEKKK